MSALTLDMSPTLSNIF